MPLSWDDTRTRGLLRVLERVSAGPIIEMNPWTSSEWTEIAKMVDNTSNTSNACKMKWLRLYGRFVCIEAVLSVGKFSWDEDKAQIIPPTAGWKDLEQTTRFSKAAQNIIYQAQKLFFWRSWFQEHVELTSSDILAEHARHLSPVEHMGSGSSADGIARQHDDVVAKEEPAANGSRLRFPRTGFYALDGEFEDGVQMPRPTDLWPRESITKLLDACTTVVGCNQNPTRHKWDRICREIKGRYTSNQCKEKFRQLKVLHKDIEHLLSKPGFQWSESSSKVVGTDCAWESLGKGSNYLAYKNYSYVYRGAFLKIDEIEKDPGPDRQQKILGVNLGAPTKDSGGGPADALDPPQPIHSQNNGKRPLSLEPDDLVSLRGDEKRRGHLLVPSRPSTSSAEKTSTEKASSSWAPSPSSTTNIIEDPTRPVMKPITSNNKTLGEPACPSAAAGSMLSKISDVSAPKELNALSQATSCTSQANTKDNVFSQAHNSGILSKPSISISLPGPPMIACHLPTPQNQTPYVHETRGNTAKQLHSLQSGENWQDLVGPLASKPALASQRPPQQVMKGTATSEAKRPAKLQHLPSQSVISQPADSLQA